MMNCYQKLLSILLLYFVVAQQVFALDEIVIGKGVERGMPIAVVPFYNGSDDFPKHTIDHIINSNLSATGKFEPMDSTSFLSLPYRNDQVRFKDWRLINADGLVIGEIRPQGNKQYEIEFRLYDVPREKMLGGFVFKASEDKLRHVAHEISDFVYEAFTGRPGAFTSKLAYVKRVKKRKKSTFHLMVSDHWDGYEPREVLQSKQPIFSPAWSADLNKLAYTTFGEKGSIVKVLDLITGSDRVVAAYKGINGSPAWSPDGQNLIFTSSRWGNADLFVKNMVTNKVRQLTRHYAIDTEASWTADGNSVLFTSGRAGRPQIYELNLATEKASRLTFTEKENSKGSYSFDKKSIVMVAEGGKIAVMQKKTGKIKFLTNSKFDESPSFSLNGDMVLYATQKDQKGRIVVASSDGRVSRTLEFLDGDVREPAWSPVVR